MYAISLITDKFPAIRQKLIHAETSVNLSDTETLFYQLALHFKKPNAQPFDLALLGKLDGEWLEFALDTINIYFHNDTYLIPEETHSYTIDGLLNQTDFARILSEKGLDYTQAKINVYYKRHKLPKPTVLLSGVPYWNLYAVNSYVQAELEKDKTKKEINKK